MKASSERDVSIEYLFWMQTTGAICSASSRWWGLTLEMPRWRIRPASRNSVS
jgi:hypothetical protein